ncbi:hypothetical protein KV110_14825 [Nocardia iowensis]|uniref:DUF4352 domain-containing protein n=1 Tax=Nocardia iowensis TaxID=204891 RepID=A0ABX8S3A0_NOCIO|nr:hypothetical protein KV110_14825 [Nocardia iowensis]
MATTIAAAVVGFAGPASAIPSDPVVQFTPTLSRVPGGNCAAIINGETVPQPQSGSFGVRVKITQTGQSCEPYRVAVRFRNLDSGYSDGQMHRVDGNGVIDAPDGVITGFGTAPGAGRVEAWIVTLDMSHPQPLELEHMAGRATFTLG